MKEANFPQPSIEEQEKYVLQRDLQEIIEQKRARQRELLSELEKSVFNQLMKNFDGEYIHLSEIADISSGITKGRKVSSPKRSVPYLAVANVQAGKLQLNTVKSIEATEKEIAKYRLLPNDIVVTEGGDPDKLGRGTVWRGELPEAIHQNHIFRIRIKNQKKFNPELIEAYLQHKQARTHFIKSAKQTTGIASINKTQLCSLKIPIGINSAGFKYNSIYRLTRGLKNEL